MCWDIINEIQCLKVANSHGLAKRLIDIHLFSQSYNRSYFPHRFLPGSHSCVVFWSFLWSFLQSVSIVDKSGGKVVGGGSSMV